MFSLAVLLLGRGGMSLLPHASSSVSCEIVLGRALAACVHPVAAWHADRRSFRVLALAGYFAAGFVVVFATLVLTNY